MTKLFAMVIPVVAGKTEQLKKFANNLKNAHRKEFNESRKAMGVQERTFFQSTPMGDMIIVTLEGKNPEAAFQKLGQKNDEFTKWFIAQTKEIHGIDLSQKQQGGLPELLVESDPIIDKVNA